MVVNKEGDLELYAVHDTPTHTPWSPRGDLTLGIGRSYRIIPGFQSREPPLEPWEVVQPSVPHSAAHSVERFPARERSTGRSHNNSPPTFGRGDEDGFPALKSAPANISATRPTSRSFTPALPKGPTFSYAASTKLDSGPELGRGHGHGHSQSVSGQKLRHSHSRRGRESSTKRIEPTNLMHKNIECDISMIMRYRVIHGYGLTNVSPGKRSDLSNIF